MTSDDKMLIERVVLAGRIVRLEPLTQEHLEALCKVGLDHRIWKWTANVVNEPCDIRRFVDGALADEAAGSALPFATIDLASGQAVGSTRFGNIDQANRKVEIGWTWISPIWQRTPINTEAKLLMFTHAFEAWGCVRLELKTDALNHQSRAAIARIGGIEEGTLRNHMITESGRFRDSVVFSIIDKDWPNVKANLESRLVIQNR